VDRQPLAFDWNGERERHPSAIQLNDETLRDGLQSPSVRQPSPEAAIRLLHLMSGLGIDAATIGYPAAGDRMLARCGLLAAEVASARLPIAVNCSARALAGDLAPIANLAARTGIAVEAAIFLGSSALRQVVEGCSLGEMVRAVDEAVAFGVREGLPVMFVAEDATRARPEPLAALCLAAVRAGAGRLCLADTAGHVTPEGVVRLVEFLRGRLASDGAREIKLDWHGHRDRGLAIANCLAAIHAGVDRVHGTALGVGERAGNAEMELLLANLYLLGDARRDLRQLPEYCRFAADVLDIELPRGQPVVGADAFRTGSGLHAATMVKAERAALGQLADLLYTSLPARAFGLSQRIVVSPMSGRANVRAWLRTHGHDAEDARLADALLAAAKQSDRTLSDAECAAVVARSLAAATAPE
jgi:isopropylmalate/homocitrate/citramalate synthase